MVLNALAPDRGEDTNPVPQEKAIFASMHLFSPIFLVLVATVIVALNIMVVRRRRGTMDLNAREYRNFLSVERLEARFQEATHEYQQCKTWEELAVERWAWVEAPCYQHRPFLAERYGFVCPPPLSDTAESDPALSYSSGVLYGFGRNHILLVEKHYTAKEAFDVVYHMYENDQRFYMRFEGPHKALAAFGRGVNGKSGLLFWEEKNSRGILRESYRYENGQLVFVSTQKAIYYKGKLQAFGPGGSWNIGRSANGEVKIEKAG